MRKLIAAVITIAVLDVHMGRHDFQCATCHRTDKHQIAGCSMSVSTGARPRVQCTDCHIERPHQNDRLDAHTKTVACPACHIPRMAIDTPTQMYWDWSEAGQDRGIHDRFVYMKSKGSFQYVQNIRPEYFWYNGRSERYLTGDRIDPEGPVRINYPLGGPSDPTAKIWPFKVHYEKQIYDTDLMHNRQVDLVLLDVRTPSDFNQFHLVDAENVSPALLQSRWPTTLPREAIVVAMCNDEIRSTGAWKLLQVQGATAEGHVNAYILAGGINRWLDLYGDQAADVPVSDVAADGNGELRHAFTAALDCRLATARPDPKRVPKREYKKKVKSSTPQRVLMTSGGRATADCGQVFNPPNWTCYPA